MGEAGSKAVDVVFDGVDCHILEGERVASGNTHGTGCTMASVIAAEIARGVAPLMAIRAAKTYMSAALKASVGLQIGSGPSRPLNHGFESSDWTGAARFLSGWFYLWGGGVAQGLLDWVGVIDFFLWRTWGSQ